MARGGKTTPPARTPPGGPGRYSRRTDGQQVATPGIGTPGPEGESSLQYGDVGKLESAQKIAPLPAGTPPPRPRQQAGQPVNRADRLPPYLFDMAQPGSEPTTTGLDVGPGAGSEALDARERTSDIRETELMRLWLWYGNKDAFDLLQKLRGERALAAPVAPAATPPTQPGSSPVPVPASATPTSRPGEPTETEIAPAPNPAGV